MHRICASVLWMVAACWSGDDGGDFPVVPGGTTTIGGRVPGPLDAASSDAVPGDAGVDDGGLGPDASGSLDAPFGLPDSAGGSLDAPL